VFVVEVRVLVVAGEGDEVVVAGGLVSLEAAGHGEMVVQVVVVRAFGVPHSCAKARMNGPPGGYRRVTHPPLGMGLMVVQVVVARASGVPHSCPKCAGMNGPPGLRW